MAALVLGLFRARSVLGLSPLYIVMGGFQYLEATLSVQVELWPGFVLYPGSSVMFTANLFAVLLVYLKEDAARGAQARLRAGARQRRPDAGVAARQRALPPAGHRDGDPAMTARRSSSTTRRSRWSARRSSSSTSSASSSSTSSSAASRHVRSSSASCSRCFSSSPSTTSSSPASSARAPARFAQTIATGLVSKAGADGVLRDRRSGATCGSSSRAR